MCIRHVHHESVIRLQALLGKEAPDHDGVARSEHQYQFNMGLGGLCRGLNAFILFLAATLYLILGLALIAAAAATFFTSYGEIFAPLYAGSSIGVGVAIVLVAIVGYCAACRQKACWLGIFMFFDLIVIVVIIAVSVLMFRYEDVLKVAGDVGIQGDVNSGLDALNKFETQTIRNVVQNVRAR